MASDELESRLLSVGLGEKEKCDPDKKDEPDAWLPLARWAEAVAEPLPDVDVGEFDDLG
jgi:hypothetical protein